MLLWKTKRMCDSQPIQYEPSSLEIEKEKDSIISPISGNRIYFYSDVTKDSIYLLNRQIEEVTKQLKIVQLIYNLPTPPTIELLISSEGGDVLAGLSSVDKILNNPIPIHTHCEGIVASAATLISVVGKKRTMSKNSVMMIHQLSSGVWGNYQQLKEEIQNLDLIMSIIKDIYLEYTDFKEDELEEMLKHDIILNTDKCLKNRLVDEVI